MPQNYCHHINAAGAFCRGFPAKKRDYCYWHLHETGRRMKAARARARSEPVLIQLPILDDLHAVQVGLMQLGEAIVHGEIDDRRGRLLLAVLRLAASNIKAQGSWLDDEQMQPHDTDYVGENAGFERQYGLPQGIDLSLAPEVAFPPPQPGGPHIPSVGMCGSDNPPLNPNDRWSGTPGLCGNENDVRSRFGQLLRSAATPIPGTNFQATADDMELMDVYERQGEQAGLRCAGELERNRRRRERRERRAHYEQLARNRNIQLAAEKLFMDQQRNGEAARPAAADPPLEQEINRKPPQSHGDSPVAAAMELTLSTP